MEYEVAQNDDRRDGERVNQHDTRELGVLIRLDDHEVGLYIDYSQDRVQIPSRL